MEGEKNSLSCVSKSLIRLHRASRSSEWGVMPPHWYFSSALPRALLGALPLALLGGILERRVRPSLAIALVFVGLYSALPHKEVSTPIY